MNQSGKVANPARCELNRENKYFPVPARDWKFGPPRRVRPSRPAAACSFSILRLNLYTLPYAMTIRTLAVGRRRQSESIEVALDVE